MIKKISYALIIGSILVVNIIRFWGLDDVPYGYNVDELAGAVTVQCLATENVDAHLTPHPLFFEQHWATPKPPNYVYPAALWSKIFGFKIDKLRAFSAFFTILSLVGIFFLGRLILNTSYGLLAVLMASISPWIWCLSRIAYESTFCVAFIVWGLYFFLGVQKIWGQILAGALFCGAAYIYPPCRMQIPLLILTLCIFNVSRNSFNKKLTIAFFLAFFIFSLPLVHATIWGHLQQRFNEISIFNDQFLHSKGKTKNIIDIASIVLNHLALHFDPQYLLKKGDTIGGHTSGQYGILSWLDVAGFSLLVITFVFRFKTSLPHLGWILFLAANLIIGMLPACLTFIDLPSALRTIGAFPFACFLSAYGLWRLCQKWDFFYLITLSAAIIFSFVYLKNYFTVYKKESMGWFSFWVKEEALNAKTQEDWLKFMVHNKDNDYHFRYFLMNYRNESCSSSRAGWIKLRELLGLSKAY